MEHADFEVMCAALEVFEKGLLDKCEPTDEEEIEQLIENAYEMLRQAEVMAKGHCPACGDVCVNQPNEAEDVTIDCCSATFVLNADEGELSLELRNLEGGLMEVTEWVKCPAVEQEVGIFYSTGKAMSKLLRLLARQLDRKRKLSQEIKQ